MTAPVNLGRKRKEAARNAARKTADENAARHGLSKAELLRQRAEAFRAKRNLDQHKRDDT